MASLVSWTGHPANNRKSILQCFLRSTPYSTFIFLSIPFISSRPFETPIIFFSVSDCGHHSVFESIPLFFKFSHYLCKLCYRTTKGRAPVQTQYVSMRSFKSAGGSYRTFKGVDMRVKEETLNTVAVAILCPNPSNFEIILTGHHNPVSRYRPILTVFVNNTDSCSSSWAFSENYCT